MEAAGQTPPLQVVCRPATKRNIENRAESAVPGIAVPKPKSKRPMKNEKDDGNVNITEMLKQNQEPSVACPVGPSVVQQQPDICPPVFSPQEEQLGTSVTQRFQLPHT